MKDIEEFCPSDKNDWRNWLSLNHKDKDAVWVIFYKKKSSNHNMNWSDSVDEALCFGWIDSTKKTIDNEKFKQYFSKRKPKSNWSKVNKDKVKALIDQKLMSQAGLKTIEVAKENGSWTFLDSVEAIIIPDDLKKALIKRKNSFEFYQSLSNSQKKIILYWVKSAKREETRNKRITDIVQNAVEELLPKQFR